jgi:hypothetical protein
MLKAVNYVLAVLFIIGGGALAAYKYYLGGGIELIDWASSGLLALGGAGYILYPLPAKIFNGLKNMKLPKFGKAKTKEVVNDYSGIITDRDAIDHLMQVGIKFDNKLIIENVILLNDAIFKLRHQGQK